MALEIRRRAESEMESSILGLWGQSRARTTGTRCHFVLHEPSLDAFLSAMQAKVYNRGPFRARIV